MKVYNLNRAYIKLECLSYISPIINNGVDQYYFRYQVNNFLFDSEVYDSEQLNKLEESREKLIQAWEKHNE